MKNGRHKIATNGFGLKEVAVLMLVFVPRYKSKLNAQNLHLARHPPFLLSPCCG
jgi:hypothetical protein